MQRQAYFPKLEALGLAIGDGKKKIFVQDKTGNKPLKPVKESEPVETPKEPIKKTREWKKMTTRKYVLDILYNNPMSTEEIARQYIKDGHSNKPLRNVKATISVAISFLRKEGYPIIKIKAGRYGIKREN
jgi:hypothetical protein